MIKSNIQSEKVKNLCQVECSSEYRRIEEDYYNSQGTLNINEQTKKINQYSSLIRNLDKQWYIYYIFLFIITNSVKYDNLIAEFPEEEVKSELSMFFDDRFKLFSIANEYEQNNLMIQELDKNYKNYLSIMNQRKNQLIFNFDEKKYIIKLL